MAPKIKVTRDDIIEAAIRIIRMDTGQSINARAIAAILDCSTQPIFSNFGSMDDLRLAVFHRANEMFQEYVKREIDSRLYPEYKAAGIAYVKFAKEERCLFKFLFMCDRSNGDVFGEFQFDESILDMVRDNTGLDIESARFFHLEIWMYVHGIATLFATNYLDLDMGLVSNMITDAYMGLRKQHGLE